MSDRKKLTRKQLAVIEDLFAGELDETQVHKKHNVSTRVYNKWQADEAFIQQFQRRIAAAYRQSAIPAIARAIERGVFKVTAPYSALNLRLISEEEIRLFDPGLASFTNLNVPRQLPLLTQI